MSNIHVRRSGLLSFVIRLGSLLTGLVFTVMVTSHLTASEFGLWSLIGRTLGYSILPSTILAFWATRYRARGSQIGKTILVGSGIFTAAFSLVFLAISIPISMTLTQASSSSNFFYFLLSTPQVALFTFVGSLEAILLAVSPEKNSIDFASFEIAKVVIGFALIDVLKESLTGAILAIIVAQCVQLVLAVGFAKNEFRDKISLGTISKMVKNGWLAMLNNLNIILMSFDFLIIGAFTHSSTLLALFAAALIFSSIPEYSYNLGQGLYPNILAGGDPKTAARQILELELLFLAPMVLGGILLRTQLLHLLNPEYVAAAGILVILVTGSIFDSLQGLFESTITAMDKTDSLEHASLSMYLKGKLFLVAKINLIMAAVYLGSLSVVGFIFGPAISSNPNSVNNDLLFAGMIWAAANAVISLVALVFKVYYVRKFAPFSLDLKFYAALLVGSLVFGVMMYFIGITYVPPQKSEVVQALNIFGIGILGLGVYGSILFLLSKAVRSLVKTSIHNLRSMIS